MTNKLAGKVAVITGASTGIGLAAAKRFIREGMDRVFITGRRENALDAAVAEIGEKATGIPGDVASLTDLLRETENAHGQYEPNAPKHHWSDWYAAYMVERQQGKTPEDAVKAATLHTEGQPRP